MKGFTLIELLVVIGIIVILMTAALVAINPFKQFAMANNASRWSGVTTTMNAISQRMVDKKGKFSFDDPDFAITDCPAKDDDLPNTTPVTIIGSGASQYDICSALVPEYVGTLPYDPQNGNFGTLCTDAYNTRYSIKCDTNKRITICAEDTQIPPEATKICITR